MKLPRISVGAIMVGLIVVAIDCVLFRSFQSRPQGLVNDLWLVVLATLPMANLLAVGMASLAGGRTRLRRNLVGFEAGGGVALFVTAVRIRPSLDWLESALKSWSLERWITSSPIHEEVATYAILCGLPIVFQMVVAVAMSFIFGMIGSRRGWTTADAEATPRRGRLSFRSMLVLLVLVVIPAVAVEEILRRKVDPLVARLVIGTDAVVDLGSMAKDPVGLPKNSKLRPLIGMRVRVKEDRAPNIVQETVLSTGETISIRDYRAVQVTLLEGDRAGESIGMPYFLLRPIRSTERR